MAGRYSRAHTADGGEQTGTAERRQQTQDSRQGTADGGEQTGDSRWGTADRRQQTEDSRRGTADREQQSECREEMADWTIAFFLAPPPVLETLLTFFICA